MINVVMFAEDLPKEKQAEGLGIHQAVVSGECDKCPCIALCSSDENFKFPEDAFCMKAKRKFLHELGGVG